MPAASMTGSIRLKLPVISTTLAMAVSGDWVAAAKTPAHGHDRIDGRRPDNRSEDVVDGHSEGHAPRRPGEQRRGEHPARATDREGEAGCHDLAHHENGNQPQDVVAGDDLVHHRVAHAVHLGQGQEKHTERHTADRRASPFGTAFPKSVDQTLETVQKGLEPDSDESGQEPEHANQQVGGVMSDREIVRYLRRRRVPSRRRRD